MTEIIENNETEKDANVRNAEVVEIEAQRAQLADTQRHLIYEAYSLRRQLETMPKQLAQIEQELDQVTAQLSKLTS
jgi:seryl-tRNA synthetase